MNPKLRSDLIRDEGLRLQAYQDSVGLWTIGVGHLLGSQPRMKSITQDEAMALLEWDAKQAASLAAELALNISLDSPRGVALVNMAFNLGGRLKGFNNFLACLRGQDWTGAKREMLNSKWAEQVGARAHRLADIIETGVET